MNSINKMPNLNDLVEVDLDSTNHLASENGLKKSHRHDNILSTIGNTPVVRLNKLAPEHVNIFVKLEAFNPLGSVKDRLAIGIIEAAERDGSLTPGQTVVEATSGNTGIALAMVCAQKGYPLVIVMAENFSVERRRLMRYLGAKVILTPASDMGSGMLAKAVELADTHGWFLCRQFENEANPDVHSATTAVEILNDFPEGSLDYFVSGLGTGGTLKGIARVLRQHSPTTHIVATEPDNSPMLSSGIAQKINATDGSNETHPAFRPHLMQGWTPDFISKHSEDSIKDDLIDTIVPVGGIESLRLSRELSRQEGILCGITSGAALAGALEIAKTAPVGANILCIFADTGERYLSTQLFEHISSDMSEDEATISTSTAGYRFDCQQNDDDSEPEEVAKAPVKAEAVEFIESVIQSTSQPVVMFSLEWCEFCWSLRKLFNELGIEYRSIDLDSVEYQKNDWGGDVWAALSDRTGIATIPQVFVGGTLMGGCSETLDAYREGELQSVLEKNSIKYNTELDVDSHSFLPSWLHAR